MQIQETGLATLSKDHSRREGFYAAGFKRAIDIIVAPLLFVCCLPLMAVAALAVVLESMDSPFYGQDRVGLDGRVFRLHKIRTMYNGADASGFRTQEEDSRVTRIGRFLRSSKIDELPQLLNVICGDMSLIGPRPLSVEETRYLVTVEGFEKTTPGLVPTVLPGMTGLEQCTRSSLHPYGHRFWLNSYYETHVSLWQDCWIIKRTLMVCPGVCLVAAITGVGLAGWFTSHVLMRLF